MLDSVSGSIQGFVKIIDNVTGEILVDTHNDVLYGNISMALAHSLIGNSSGFLNYMAFGNGGAYVTTTGSIAYKDSFGGAGSLVKNPTANLYNTVYVKKLSNDATSSANYNELSKAYILSQDFSTNYEDIVIDVTLGYNELPIALTGTTSTELSQLNLDDSAFISSPGATTSSTISPDTLVFNEIALFSGSNDLFIGDSTQNVSDVTRFVNQGVNFSSGQSKLMLTHVVFHPIQKSANRSLEIIYTLRIQMGAR